MNLFITNVTCLFSDTCNINQYLALVINYLLLFKVLSRWSVSCSFVGQFNSHTQMERIRSVHKSLFYKMELERTQMLCRSGNYSKHADIYHLFAQAWLH